MWDIISYLLIMVLLAAAVVAAAFVVRSYLSGTSPTASFFGPKPDPRLGVIEQSNVDGRRKLLLIRRDDVEHLIMTGGPVDVVIETNISNRRPRGEVVDASSAVFARQPRTFGQAASGE
jgi:flagellar protein FliO/FliZ